MKISVLPANELDATLIARWKHIQTHDDTLRSPYYSPGFTQLVAASGQNVQVAVIESAGLIEGFFPFQKLSYGRLVPVGNGLNDYHGMIASPGLAVDAATLMKACKGHYFGFNHLPLTQTVFAPFVRMHSVSPVLELAGGWDAYVQRLCAVQNTRSPGILSTVKSSFKRIERDIGPVRFEMHESSPQVLAQLMRLKSEQRARTVGLKDDPFALPWVQHMMRQGLELQDINFRAEMCAMYAGDKLVSIHYGIRSDQTLHWWFPVFDPEYSYYQPGLILLKKAAETGDQQGLTLIDLGRGDAHYKMRFKTAQIALGEGAVSRPALLAKANMGAKLVKQAIKANPKVVQLRRWMSEKKQPVPE